MGIKLGRAASDIYDGNLGFGKPVQNALHRFARHDFFSFRPCIDVTMGAGLVAFFADVHLQNACLFALQR